MPNSLKILFLIFATIYISSCVSRGQPIDQQVVYYMENFDDESYTKYTQKNGDIIYYPNEMIGLVESNELHRFQSSNFKIVKIKNKKYYLPNNRLLIQKVQSIRKQSNTKLREAEPVRSNKTYYKNNFDIIVVGEPPEVDTLETIQSIEMNGEAPKEQLAH